MFRQRICLHPERTKEIPIADEFAEDFAQLETGLKAYINFLCFFYTVIQERGQLRLSKPEEVGER